MIRILPRTGRSSSNINSPVAAYGTDDPGEFGMSSAAVQPPRRIPRGSHFGGAGDPPKIANLSGNQPLQNASLRDAV